MVPKNTVRNTGSTLLHHMIIHSIKNGIQCNLFTKLIWIHWPTLQRPKHCYPVTSVYNWGGAGRKRYWGFQMLKHLIRTYTFWGGYFSYYCTFRNWLNLISEVFLNPMLLLQSLLRLGEHIGIVECDIREFLLAKPTDGRCVYFR